MKVFIWWARGTGLNYVNKRLNVRMSSHKGALKASVSTQAMGLAFETNLQFRKVVHYV